MSVGDALQTSRTMQCGGSVSLLKYRPPRESQNLGICHTEGSNSPGHIELPFSFLPPFQPSRSQRQVVEGGWKKGEDKGTPHPLPFQVSGLWVQPELGVCDLGIEYKIEILKLDCSRLVFHENDKKAMRCT